MSPTEPTGTGDPRALNERLHRLSHDLKNRIGATLEALRGLREPVPGLDADELHRFAERNLFLAMHTLERALDDLGVERGPGALDLRPTDLASIARLAAERSAARFARKQQTLDLDIAGPLPIRGEQDVLVDLVHALLTNASKFAPEGSTIRMQAIPHDQDAVVRVIDRGVGLSAEDLAQVFDRYAWLGSQPTAGEGQSRSTLARARQWAQAHGGRLVAHSAGPGTGCTFMLAVPLSSGA
ncbi:MAG: HAMP domain-containing histidine kinase [Flavobacteriales bacterium]|nr:HAMP domain-containing histidine kinase [Flavobacteriales bacterium]MBK7940965.1 HAMP domain-containing histidine kinase [Flavobacteriales bacterium]MBK8948386.1 HAMP domain-containing histidine kinase [Flavobacteriales bacterium]MBK9701612.1 HAMP domain-containing histidine kinase [Flavobacteriales bacterium]